MNILKTIWSGLISLYDYLLSIGITNNEAVIIIITLSIIILSLTIIYYLIRNIWSYIIKPLIELLNAYISDVFMTNKKFNKNKGKHPAFSFNSETLMHDFYAFNSEIKFKKLVEDTFSQGSVIYLANGSKYKVDVFIRTKSNNNLINLKNWNKTMYHYHLVPILDD